MKIITPYNIDLDILSADETLWSSFAKKFVILPKDVKDILLLDNTTAFLLDISHQLTLNEEQTKELTRIIRDVLLGDIFINDMSATISQKLNADQQTAQQIRDKIVKELFASAIEDIKKIQQDKFPDRVGQGSVSTMPQPPAPPQMKNVPPVNQSNVIDLRNQPQ